MQKEKNLPLRVTVALSMLVAISIICGKYLAIRGGDILRFSFENLPIIFSGMVFGPIAGALVGVAADLIGCLLVGYAINPLVTVGAAIIGVSSGISRLLTKKIKLPIVAEVATAIFASHLLGSVIVKTVGLAVYYDMPIYVLMLWRLLNYLIVGAVEGVILTALLKSKALTSTLGLAHDQKKTKAKEKDMNYTEALEYIHGISHVFCKPGLERISELCDRLGHPEKDLRFIHVAGTNGKGSFCSMTDSILRAAGYKVGLYTSPYIYEFNERMRVDGKNIPNETLARLTEKVREVADTMTDKPTEFELITAIAFEYFKSEKCDLVVLEVGLGGRFDSTNIIRNPLLSVITGIALDHTAFLGDTTAKIAAEKAGIIKDGAPVIWGGNDEAAREVIMNTAKERDSAFYETSPEKLTVKESTLGGTVFSYKERENYKISLLGTYQPKNASLVLDAIDILRECGLTIGEDAVRKGLEETKWRARFEIIMREPTVIFDGAHNPEGIRAAVDSIKHFHGKNKIKVFTGVLRDKDYAVIAKTLSEVADEAFTITPDNPRALSAEEYAAVLSNEGIMATSCTSVKDALAKGIDSAKKSGSTLYCLGSLYTYVEVINAIKSLQ